MRSAALLITCSLFASGCCSWSYEELEAAKHPDDRREALACLAEDAQDDPDLRQKLLRVCAAWVSPTVQPDPAVRATCHRILRSLAASAPVGSGVSLVVERSLPAEPTAHVRVEAVTTLAALAGPAAEGPLVARMAVDPSADVRMVSARELRQLAKGKEPTPQLTEAFVKRLDDAHLGVRLHARRGLITLYPKVDEGLSSAGWRAFLLRKRQGIAGPHPGEDGPPAVPQEDGPPPVPPEEGPPPVPQDRPEDQPPKPEDYPFPDEPLDAPEVPQEQTPEKKTPEKKTPEKKTPEKTGG